jgi:hypothetical protein
MALPFRTLGGFIRVFAAVVTLFGFLVSSIGPSYAAGGQTGSLRGVVVDAGTKAPIANVAIIAASPSGRFSAKTDQTGTFSIIGVSIDTYTVTFTLPGYDTLSLNGINVTGDNTVNLTESLQKTLQTIGRTTARSRSSAYQPAQTIDSVSVSGARAETALGKNLNTSENQLALSVPGVQLTNGNRLTIRGGLSTEVGYQLDGIDFTEPFLFGNANNGISVGTASLQVVEGAGDATQGGIGGGVVNSILKRGAYPPFGLVDAEVGSPNFNHQAGIEYGIATPDGRFSDYITYVGQRFDPYYGPSSTNQIDVGNIDALSYEVANDFVNNFVFRFGKGNNQSLQVAYLNHDLQQFGDLGGLSGRLPNNINPYNLESLPLGGSGDSYFNTAFYAARYGIPPQFLNSPATITSAEEIGYNPSRYLKFEYTNSLNPTTFLDISAANVDQIRGSSNWYSYANNASVSETGGSNAVLKTELTHQFGDTNTTTIGFNLDNKHPIWNDYAPFLSDLILEAYQGAPGFSQIGDFATPPNTSLPVSATNPCPNTNPAYAASAVTVSANPCYVYEHTGYAGRLPLFGINYNGTDNQEYGFYLRDQYNPFSKLHLDLGARYDGLNWKQGANPYNTQPGSLSNPDDVAVGIGPGGPPNFLRDDVVHPKFVEPRVAAAYQLTNNDSLRFGYGRSVIFPNAQSLGTPMYLSGLPSSVLNLPAIGNTADPATWTCGSGFNPQWAASTTAANFNAAKGGSFFRCANYGQQLYWQNDQNFDAPDVGNNQPQTTSNTDLTLQHQFRNGLSLKFTGYYKREFAVPAFALISQVLNAQGAPTSQVFGVDNVGINKTSGAEFGLQTADRPSGFTGYLSATYTNVIDSVPPLVGSEDQLPLIPAASLVLGDTYRAGYVSPFVTNIGIQYKTRSGFRINPILSYDRGFPIGVGNYIASADPFGGYANLPQSNINPPILSGFQGVTGAFNATNYVDPVNPGTIIRPNIAATRGTAETAAPGGVLSRPRLNTDITFEYTHSRSTFGLLVQNLFGNPYGEPIPNPYYQPVSTGLAGAQTGQTNAAIPGTVPYNYGGFRNIPTQIYGSNAYILPFGFIGSNTSRPLTLRAYYQLGL